MPYTFIQPPFSFLRWNDPDPATACCDGGSSFMLPVVLATDVQFQFSLLFDTSIEADAAMNDAPSNMMLVLLKGIDTTPQTIGVNNLYDFTISGNLYFTKYRTGPQRVTYAWLNGFPGFMNYLACNACFQIAVTGSVGGPGIVLISNGFIRRCSTCESSVLQYGSDNNYADFVYCSTSSFVNRIRLPFYLKQPKPISDRAIYRQTNGVIRRTKSLITKQYEGESDYLPELVHDRLVVALEHDAVRVESDTYTGDISASDYDIDWQDDECTAQASFKALATPFFVKRSNCSTC